MNVLAALSAVAGSVLHFAASVLFVYPPCGRGCQHLVRHVNSCVVCYVIIFYLCFLFFFPNILHIYCPLNRFLAEALITVFFCFFSQRNTELIMIVLSIVVFIVSIVVAAFAVAALCSSRKVS